jgi:hypothetical protein
MAGENREPDADLTSEGGTGEAGSAGGAAPPGRGDTTPGTGAPAIPPAVADLFARLEAGEHKAERALVALGRAT